MSKQPEKNGIVIMLTVKVLIAQDAFLLETQGMVKPNRALIVQ